MKFQLESEYKPGGDQPEAIRQLTEALNEGVGDITLLGVTGSGKTFTMANVIANLQRPALILSHNKTLAAQLYGEFKAFFPNNAVEYSSPTMTIISRRRISPLPIPISRRTSASTTR